MFTLELSEEMSKLGADILGVNIFNMAKCHNH